MQSSSTLSTTPLGRDKRLRTSAKSFVGLPDLTDPECSLLKRWLKSDAQERQWQKLLDEGSTANLDRAQPLLEKLLLAGAAQVKEEFRHGQWRAWRVVWCELDDLKQALQLSTRAERQANKDDLVAQLQAMADAHPWLGVAVTSCLKHLPSAASRLDLLQGLVLWKESQRQGMRQDFALAVREHTKAITATEWDWLDNTLSLDALGITRFEALLWLAGDISLARQHNSSADGQSSNCVLDIQGYGFIGLPCVEFSHQLKIHCAPLLYWLIENRASFERNARQLSPNICLVWLPGRPSTAWLQAMRWLLVHAPANAEISCDPDPAGIQIALTAGQLWQERGLNWQPKHMSPSRWQHGKTLPLTPYDHRVLTELQTQVSLPQDLIELRDYILHSEKKAEQEGWL
jgi:hypothetical protein